jgi:hypothetical protein
MHTCLLAIKPRHSIVNGIYIGIASSQEKHKEILT